MFKKIFNFGPKKEDKIKSKSIQSLEELIELCEKNKELKNQ